MARLLLLGLSLLRYNRAGAGLRWLGLPTPVKLRRGGGYLMAVGLSCHRPWVVGERPLGCPLGFLGGPFGRL
eukprot:302191-Pyramimonas_sp.AAC.1